MCSLEKSALILWGLCSYTANMPNKIRLSTQAVQNNTPEQCELPLSYKWDAKLQEHAANRFYMTEDVG